MGKCLRLPSWGRGGLAHSFFVPFPQVLLYPQKGTYGRSPKKPTVGFEDDLPWVASTTYSRFYFGLSEGLAPSARDEGVES